MNATGRDEPCPCGSGKKYRKCCRERDVALARQSLPGNFPADGESTFTALILPEVDETIDRLLCRMEKGQCENVEAKLKALLREHPGYHTANYAMGVFRAMVLKDLDGAIPLFQKAVRVFPPMPEAHYNLGTCYSQTARIGEAVASLRKAIQYSANDDFVAEKARARQSRPWNGSC